MKKKLYQTLFLLPILCLVSCKGQNANISTEQILSQYSLASNNVYEKWSYGFKSCLIKISENSSSYGINDLNEYIIQKKTTLIKFNHEKLDYEKRLNDVTSEKILYYYKNGYGIYNYLSPDLSHVDHDFSQAETYKIIDWKMDEYLLDILNNFYQKLGDELQSKDVFDDLFKSQVYQINFNENCSDFSCKFSYNIDDTKYMEPHISYKNYEINISNNLINNMDITVLEGKYKQLDTQRFYEQYKRYTYNVECSYYI